LKHDRQQRVVSRRSEPVGTSDPNAGNNQATDSDTVQPISPPPVVVQHIPTLSPWALILLALALGWTGIRARRRR
jgi:hypothetical protein